MAATTVALPSSMDGLSIGKDQRIMTSTNERNEKGTGLGGVDTTGMAIESGSEDEEEGKSTANKKVSDRRRAQNVKFSSWYASRIGSSNETSANFLQIIGYRNVQR